MIDGTAFKALAATQKRVMRAWTKLEVKRDVLITSLRDVEQEMSAMDPVVKALFHSSKELKAA